MENNRPIFKTGNGLGMTRINLFLIISTIILTSGCTYSQSAHSPDDIIFEQIPYSEPDLVSPGRGAEQWHNGTEAIPYPGTNSVLKSLDVYYRFTWNMLEDSAQGTYNWAFFDGLIRDAIDNGQKLSFGIMTCYGDDAEGVLKYDGGVSAYPLYLHRLMQAAPKEQQDWLSPDSIWVPNWNSQYYLDRLRALHQALYDHIMSSSYTAVQGPLEGKTISYRNAIYCIDVRGFGNYGEWHSSGLVKHVNQYPKGRRAELTTLKAIIDHHTQVFDQWPLVLMIAAFDAEQVGTIMNPVELAHYALTTRNAWGPLGWRRDQWGATDGYLDNILKNNRKRTTDGAPLSELIRSRYQTSPITGEPPRYVNRDGRCAYWDLENQVKEYGASSIGNGNWGIEMSECAQENARAAFKRAGYRIILEKANIPANLTPGVAFQATLDWKNIGVAPTYEVWDVFFELRDSSDKVVWNGQSAFRPKLFLPANKSTTIKDEFVLPADLPVGNYRLELIIKDPTQYRQPLPLAISGRTKHGSYFLREITLGE